MLNLNAGWRALILFQLNGPGIIDSPGSPYPSVGVGWGGGNRGGRCRGGRENCSWNAK